MIPFRLPFRLSRKSGDDGFSLLAGVLAVRAGLACAVFFLAVRSSISQSIGLHSGAQDAGPFWPVPLTLGIALVLTFLQVFLIHRRLVRHKMPSNFWLTVTALVDPFWIAVGYMASGYAAIPFAPLLVLALTVHGLLLSGVATYLLAAWGGLLFAAAHLIGNVQISPVFTAETQLALLMGVGIASAIFGNRIRAASRAVQGLTGAVEELSAQHVAILEGLPVGVCVIGKGRHVVYANSAFCRIAGFPDDEERAVSALLDLIPDLDRAVSGILDQSNTSGGEGESALADSRRFISWRVVHHQLPSLSNLSLSSIEVALSDNKAADASDPGTDSECVAVIIASDITDRKLADEARRQADHLAHVAELSAGLAHELRNPLAAVRSAAEQLGESESVDPMDRQLTGVILREVDRLNGLLREFLEFSRVGGGTVAEYDLADIVREATVLLRRPEFVQRGVRCDLRLTSVRALVDADLVYRIVSNLLLNAAQHTPDGEYVTVTLETAGAHAAVLRVIDRGPGIPDSIRNRIFRPFFTTRPGGTGLGLAIARRSAALLGGELELEDASLSPVENAGAIFRLTIPLRQ